MILAAANWAAAAFYSALFIFLFGMFLISVHLDQIFEAVGLLVFSIVFFVFAVMVGSGQWFPG